MYSKGFRPILALVMIIAIGGCDNVEWAGVDVELRPPPARTPEPAPETEAPGEPAIEPIELGTILHLVERSGPSEASVLPLAEFGPPGYRALPGPDEAPDLVRRLPLGRWDPGTEFALFSQGARVGTLTLTGAAPADSTGCLVRPRAMGTLELLPEAAAAERFLAFRKDDVEALPFPGGYPGLGDGLRIRTGTLDVARLLIPRVQAPWPPSIPEIRRDYAPFPLGDGSTGLAASFVYSGDLEVGEAPPLAYSLFFVAAERDGAFQPVLSWYQRVREGGKAFPRFVASMDVPGVDSPDLVLETFGAEHRWFTVLGYRDGTWQVVYRDPCGLAVPPGALRTYP